MPGDDDVSYILSEDEMIVMGEIARLDKTDDARIFSLKALKRKKPCWKLDVDSILISLQRKGLFHQKDPSKEYWAVSKEYRKVEHSIEKRFLTKKNSSLKMIKRGDQGP